MDIQTLDVIVVWLSGGLQVFITILVMAFLFKVAFYYVPR